MAEEIETLDDWNERLGFCGCCPMPTCPEPTQECVSKLINNPYYYDRQDAHSIHAPTNCDYQCGRWAKLVEEWDHNYNYSDPIPDPPGGTYTTITRTGTLTRTREYTDIIEGTSTDNYAGTATETITDRSWNADDEVWEVFRTRTEVIEPNATNDGWKRTETDTNDPGNPVVGAGSPSLTGNFDNIQANTADELAVEYSLNGDATGTYTVTGSSRITQTAYETAVDAWFAGKTADSAELDEISCNPSRTWNIATTTCGGTTEERDCFTTASERQVYYRWIIPASHEGTYYKIEWDEVFFPEDGGAATVTAKAWEWTGGDKESPWSLLTKVPAGQLGETEIRNVRMICYRATDFGSKPQYHDGFETYDAP